MKAIIYILLITAIASGFLSCGQNAIVNTKGELVKNKYAEGFEIYRIDEGFILKVKNKNSNTGNKTSDYLLSLKSENESDNNIIIQIPVTKVICMSTTHCAFISKLERENTIKGMSSPKLTYDNKIRTLLFNGDISDVGSDIQLNLEKIISLNPDVVFAFGIDNASASAYKKLIDIGIPVIFIEDFTESKPLGRTEWIKFFACFYDKLDYATEYFDSVANNYTSISNEIKKDAREKPQILVSLPWKGTWWVPGGDSFFANFIKDAGGAYIFDDNTSNESIPLSIEEVFGKASTADIWLNPNDVRLKNKIPSIDTRLKDFEPLQKAAIYNNDKRINQYGGNDFWESGIIHPDLILKDLKQIFYPDSTKMLDLYYYRRLE